MVNVKEKYRVNIEKLRELPVSILKTVQREGIKHMKYYNDTMAAFKFPERRIKCYDTKYFEETLPEIEKILIEYEQLKGK